MAPDSRKDSSGHVQISSWQDAETFALRVIPQLSGGIEARHYQSLARRLVAAAAWYVASTVAEQPVHIGEIARVVEAEFEDDPPAWPMNNCDDTRVAEEIAAVRELGRIWVTAAEPRNAAAWIALQSLATSRHR